MSYPAHGDPQFQQRLAGLKEMAVHRPPALKPVASREAFNDRVSKMCDSQQFEKSMHQHLVELYLSRTPYRSLLLYHALGTGKSCASIAVAEALMRDHRTTGPVWVVVPRALVKSYQEQIFQATAARPLQEQCTGDTYLRLVPGYKGLSAEALSTKVRHLIKSRYDFMTYEGFAEKVAQMEGRLEDFQNTLLIIDEAHNIRLGEEEKKIEDGLVKLLMAGRNNRLLLLSATPMYNDPEEIMWLLSLLAMNDKRPFKPPRLFTETGKVHEAGFAVLRQLAQEYISYVKSGDPFVFAARLSPAASGIPLLTADAAPKIGLNGKPLPTKDLDWLSNVRDGIVASTLNPPQEEAILRGDFGKKKKPKAKAGEDEGNAAIAGDEQNNPISQQQQANNIVFPGGKIGESGFLSVFTPTDDATPLQFRYSKPDRAFDRMNLPDWSCKMARIMDLIDNAKGIVVVYSQFIWSGQMPLAMALEHRGFRRYKSRSMLHGQSANTVSSPHSYAIISGKRSLMGVSNDEIRTALNSPANRDGKNIKVLLLSPIGSEGFSFKNVREMHILDGWYHLNRNEQVIGRAIRTCSHVDLNLEDRNVTVYLHATVYASKPDRMTADLHAYKIAASKARMIDQVDSEIAKWAMDCPFQRNQNWTKSLFHFDVVMTTSQNRLLPFHFGQDRPPTVCGGIDDGVVDASNWSPTTYAHIVPTAVQRIRRYLLRHPDRPSFDVQELVDATGLDRDIGMAALVALANANELFGYNGQMLRPAKIAQVAPRRIRLEVWKREQTVASELDEYLPFLRILAAHADPRVAVIDLFFKSDSFTWSNLAKLILTSQSRDAVVETAKKYLTAGGMLVDVGRVRGYVDVFADSYSLTVLDGDGTFRDASLVEVERVQSALKLHPLPTSQVYGFFAPHIPKQADAPRQLLFKIMQPSDTISGARKRRGVVCEYCKKDEIAAFAQMPVVGTRSEMCQRLAMKMLKEGRLYWPPAWKPT